MYRKRPRSPNGAARSSSVARSFFSAESRSIARNFAATLTAVTFRLQLAPLVAMAGSFDAAYPILGWSSWIPKWIPGAPGIS